MQVPARLGRHRLFDAPYVSICVAIGRPSLNLLECDSLADGDHRRPRDGDNPCECKDGWGGINCNGTPPKGSASVILISLQFASRMIPVPTSHWRAKLEDF